MTKEEWIEQEARKARAWYWIGTNLLLGNLIMFEMFRRVWAS